MFDEAENRSDSNKYAGEKPAERLLLTKLRAPRAATDGIVRSRLLDEVERGASGRLTLVVSPAGYGKSTLLGQWQSQTERASGWLTLDAADNDFHSFLEYVVAAIRSVDPSLCPRSSEALRSPSTPPTQQMISTLIDELSESTRPLVLILEDYHVISTAEVRSAVLQLLHRIPANMSLMLTSRKDPELPTLRMSARGEIVELGLADLSFTPAETKEFLTVRQGLALTATDLERIGQWAEGWPVALRLFAETMRTKPREQLPKLLDTLSESVPSIGDYLWDEVIASQSPERREFLLQTSILRQLDPDICAAVTLNQRAGLHLETLARDNLFISRLEGPGAWYRYHHIFAELLRQRLLLAFDDESVRLLHSRAANWYSDSGMIAEAAHHAVEARDWELGARCLVHICGELYAHERVGSLYRWLRNVPDEPFSTEPRLALWLAWALVRTGHPIEAQRLFALGELHARRIDSPEATLTMLQLRLLKALFAADDETGEAAAQAVLTMGASFDDTERTRALIMLGMLRDDGGSFAASADALAEARSLNDRIGIRGLRVAERSAWALLGLSQGKLREPAESFRDVIELGDEWNDLPLQNAYHKLGGIYYEWNRLEEAREQFGIAIELAERMGAPFHLAQVPSSLALLAAVTGDWDTAFDLIDQAIAASERAGYLGIVPKYQTIKCCLWLRAGQLSLAQGWLRRSGTDLLESMRYRHLSGALTALRVRIAEGRTIEAVPPLHRLATRARERGWNRALLSISTLHAIALAELGEIESARTAIDEALALGVVEGFVRSFLDEGTTVISVLELGARQNGPHRAYADALLRAAGEPRSGGSIAVAAPPNVLSPRERDVMRLVALGLSNRAIGDTLFVSEDTVKTHMRRIFEKLGVASRAQAVHRARQLELV